MKTRRKIMADVADGDGPQPEPWRAYKNQGNDLFKLADWSGAIAAYTRAWELAPDDNQAWSAADACGLLSNRAAAWLKVPGGAEAALLDADGAVARVPTWVKGYVRKALALAQLGEPVRAEAAAACALALDPKLRRDELFRAQLYARMWAARCGVRRWYFDVLLFFSFAFFDSLGVDGSTAGSACVSLL